MQWRKRCSYLINTFNYDHFYKFENFLGQMYSPELEIKDTTEHFCFLQCTWIYSIGREGQLHTSLYDKRDDFNFHITIFPFLSSNIPIAFLSHKSSDAPGLAHLMNDLFWGRIDFPISFSGRICKGYLRSSLRKFYGRYGDLIKRYQVPLSRMFHDILDDDHIQWHPPLIRHYTNCWPCYWSRPYYRISLFNLIARGFHRPFATGAVC